MEVNITSTVCITDLGKYVILVEAPPGKVDDKLYRDIAKLRDELNRWWLSDNKFMVVIQGSGVEIRFERLEEELEEDGQP